MSRDPQTLRRLRRCVVLFVLAQLGACHAAPADDPLPFWHEPWSAPKGPWPRCETAPMPRLADKAAYFDWAAVALHQLPRELSEATRVYDVDLAAEVPTEKTDAPPAVLRYRPNENSGLWSGLYAASQAFRYASTRDPEALDNLRRQLRGSRDQMRITGVPGLFARDVHNPAIPGMTCPEALEAYVQPGDDRVGNKWVRIGDDGCPYVVDPESMSWVQHGPCTEPRFSGRCWQANVSRDELSGHLFAAGITARIVDDPEIRALAIDIIREATSHVVDHHFHLTDFDGRPTRYGGLYALTLGDFPGFQAYLALTWLRMAATVTDEPRFLDIYAGCLLQADGKRACIDQPTEAPHDYSNYLSFVGQNLGCATNYDGISMLILAYANALWFDPDASMRARMRRAIAQLTGPEVQPDISAEGHPLFNFLHVAMSEETLPRDDAERLVREGACSLAAFRTDNALRASDTTYLEQACISHRHGSLAADVVPVEQRCATTYEWWGNPRSREVCHQDLTVVFQPAGYLLPYWAGRFFGFIGADD